MQFLQLYHCELCHIDISCGKTNIRILCCHITLSYFSPTGLFVFKVVGGLTAPQHPDQVDPYTVKSSIFAAIKTTSQALTKINTFLRFSVQLFAKLDFCEQITPGPLKKSIIFHSIHRICNASRFNLYQIAVFARRSGQFWQF